MMFSKARGLTLALLAPALACAQPTTTIDKASINRVLAQPQVKTSLADVRKLDLARLGIIRNLGFEDGSVCVAPMPMSSADIDFHRSLFVHDQATLGAGNFSLRRTLQKLADDVSGSAPGTTPETIFRQLWDTQNDTAHQVTAGNPHCDDNNGKVNGIPSNKCPRPEGSEATGAFPADIASRIDSDYKPIALVNRLDLAAQGWQNCGEHRIIYGKVVGGFQKSLIIFEAVLPNPKPGCRSGCRDVIEFWTDLSSDANPTSRAAKLENFYYNGLPGFRPVVNVSHYASGVGSIYGGSGSGQIRTNQFLSGGPWTLKEFKTLLSCTGGSCDFDVVPNSVKVNPYGVLWNRDVATGAVTPPLPADNSFATAIPGLSMMATNFQADVIAQVTADRLGNPDINTFTYEVKPVNNAAESQSQGPIFDDYPTQFNSASDATFKNNLNTVAGGFGLTGAQIVNRATALSCAGCHLPNGFGLTNPNSIGPGQSWPSALTFVHVDPPLTSIAGEVGFDATKFGGNTQGFTISPALLNAFLPFRRNNLVNLFNADVCDCVRKPGFLPINSPLLAQHKRIVQQSDQRMKQALATAKQQFLKKPPTQLDNRQLFQQQKSIIAKEESVRNGALAQAGVKFATPSLKPQPVMLSNERVTGRELATLKLKKVQEQVAAEPSRQTITGSFRSE